MTSYILLLNPIFFYPYIQREPLRDLPEGHEDIFRQIDKVTKLLNVFFVRALSSHLPPSLLVNAINPGFCLSELRRNASPQMLDQFKTMDQEFGLTSEEGGRSILRAKFLSIGRVVEESDFSLSKEGYEMQNRLWDETLQILCKVDPRVGDITKEYLI
ncbi:hypothetical protein C8J56DRAFT_1057187 [Mycena floridula]|nr:hypothetical protein C8J56DRAFT_1057187 [Mycena floridula]